MVIFTFFSYSVIPSFVGGAGQFGSLGVSWNAALPQHLSPSPSPSTAATDSTQTTTAPAANEDVATPTGSSHHEDDLGKRYIFIGLCARYMP